MKKLSPCCLAEFKKIDGSFRCPNCIRWYHYNKKTDTFVCIYPDYDDEVLEWV